MSLQAARQVLKQVWGYDEFLPLQAQAVEAALEHRDAIVVLPTGGGKSVCYQLPALVQQRPTIVVSPLIALMKDQVDGLLAIGVPAASLNSSIPAASQQKALDDWQSGVLRLLYVAPERLLTPSLLERLRANPPGHIAIDEAHCISSWGHDFRPEYRMLASLKRELPSVPIAAYTATATPEVRQDIVNQLQLVSPVSLVGNFHRPNLTYHVQRRTNAYNQICSVIDRYRGQAGIIYAISRNRVELISNYLNKLGYKTLPYHAGLTDEQKTRHQEMLEQDEVEAIVATIAFGMGIDKSNIRYVVHAEMPRSIENYQQESGRAGRDGLPSECWLLHSARDLLTWEKIINQVGEGQLAQAGSPSYRLVARAKACLASVQQFCHGITCRHKYLVEYFGQDFSATCHSCDICLGKITSLADPLKTSQIILSCILRCQENFGVGHVSKVLVGSSEKRLQQFGHHKLSTWGMLKEHGRRQVCDWIEQLLSQNFLQRVGEYSVLKLTASGRALLRGEGSPTLAATADKSSATTSFKIFDSWEDVDRELFEQLRVLRRQLAFEAGVAAFIVFSDATLRDLARRRPTRREILLSIHGIGERKANDYGEKVMALIGSWCQERSVASDVEFAGLKAGMLNASRSSGSAQSDGHVSKIALEAFPLFDQDWSIEQVAEKLGKATSTVQDYLESYIRQRKIKDPARWVEPALAQKIQIAASYNDSGKLRPLFDAFHGQVPYGTLRIVIACLEVSREVD